MMKWQPSLNKQAPFHLLLPLGHLWEEWSRVRPGVLAEGEGQPVPAQSPRGSEASLRLCGSGQVSVLFWAQQVGE